MKTDSQSCPSSRAAIKQKPAILNMARSYVLQERLEELHEIETHKWLESEKAGYDIGFEHAHIDWITRHRALWLIAYRREHFALN